MISRAFVTLSIFLSLAGCMSTPPRQIDKATVEKETPIISDFGRFGRSQFLKSQCANADQSKVYVLIGEKILMVDNQRFLSAYLDPKGAPLVSSIAKTLQSSDATKLGCEENPFPAKHVVLTANGLASENQYEKPFIKIGLDDGLQTTTDYAKRVASILSNSNCIVKSGFKYCPIIEQEYPGSKENGNFWYVQTPGDHPVLAVRAPFTARCQDSFSSPTCIVTDKLDRNIYLRLHYYDKSNKGHELAVSLFSEAREFGLQLINQ